VISDAVGSYFPEFQSAALAMIKAQGGIFGFVGTSDDFLAALASGAPAAATATTAAPA
jgi:hypothetical protein